MEKNSSLYNRVKVVEVVKLVKVVEVVKPLNFNHFNYCFYGVEVLRSPITKPNPGSLTSLTTLTDIGRKPPLTDSRPREVNTCNSLPGLFSGGKMCQDRVYPRMMSTFISIKQELIRLSVFQYWQKRRVYNSNLTPCME